MLQSFFPDISYKQNHKFPSVLPWKFQVLPRNAAWMPRGCQDVAVVPGVHSSGFLFLLPVSNLRFTVFCLESSMCRFQWDVWHANRAGDGSELWLQCSKQLEQRSSRLLLFSLSPVQIGEWLLSYVMESARLPRGDEVLSLLSKKCAFVSCC